MFTRNAGENERRYIQESNRSIINFERRVMLRDVFETLQSRGFRGEVKDTESSEDY